MVVKKGESGHNGGGAANAVADCTRRSGTARFCRVFQGFGPPGDLRGPFLQSVSRICCPPAAPPNPARPFLQSVSRIWASRRSPRPVFAECFKDLLPRRGPGDLRRPVSDECFKDSGLPEISAARFCCCPGAAPAISG